MTTRPAPAHGRLARLAEFAYDRRRLVLGVWVAALVLINVIAVAGKGTFAADYSTPGSSSRAAADTLQQSFPGRSPETVDVVWVRGANADAKLDAFLEQAVTLEGIGDLASPRPALSPDKTVAVARLTLTERAANVPKATGKELLDMRAALAKQGVRVELGGEVIQVAQQGPISSEALGLTIAALILLGTTGTVIAAGLPLALALFGLGIATALIALLAAVIDTPDWSVTMAAMLGIGVGIDYALLVMTRFRAALALGAEPRAAVTEAISTAGRSVVVAGTTVVISLLGLFAMGLSYLHGVAIAAIFAVLVVMAGALTLFPALLGFSARKIERLRVPFVHHKDTESPLAARWSTWIQGRPWPATIIATIVLLALASPVLGLKLGFPDFGNDPSGTSTRAAYELVAQKFGPGTNGPLLLVSRTSDKAGVEKLAALVKADPGIASVDPPVFNPAGDTAILQATPKFSPQADETRDLIHRLRDGRLRAAGVPVDVGGRTAEAVDQAAITKSRLPLFIGVVVGLSLLLLLTAFRSVMVAIKAAIMNLLSVGAAYGVVAVLADGGFLGRLVGIDTATPVPPFIPVIMFAVLFGLSMDYEVFLLSRIREEWLHSGDTASAVTVGLTRTARVISAAAAIMIVVFGALAIAPEVFLKLIGVGLATAVLVDATIVRLVLVPAVMQLLGERNWWMPKWLDRLLPNPALEEEPAREAVPV
jgi:putative drug exporter of the RND superfamily